MKQYVAVGVMVLLLVPGLAMGESAGVEAVATVTAVQGEVMVGTGGQWSPATVGVSLEEGQIIKTGKESAADISFGEGLTAAVGQEKEVEVTDLLLKTRLEAMKSKITKPTDTKKVEIQVTPTTGVRGDDQGEEKAEDLKRDHYWNTNAPQSQ